MSLQFLDQVLSGWYHLLREDVGRTKHLIVKEGKEETKTGKPTRVKLQAKRKRKEEDQGLRRAKRDRPEEAKPLELPGQWVQSEQPWESQGAEKKFKVEPWF